MKHIKKWTMNDGFTLLESIFSLFVVMISFSLLLTALPLVKKISEFDVSIEEEMAMAKIRETVLFGSDMEIYPDELFFFSMEEHVYLTLDRDRIVRRDGYLIFMDGLENSEFVQKGNCVFLKYERNNIQKERFVGCK